MSLPFAPRPSVVRCDSVLVVGPAVSGTTSVARVLRGQLPDRRFIEGMPAGECPIAVVFVVSAATPMVASDYRLLDSVAAMTDLIIGVVSKIDVHRTWRLTLDKNRDGVAEYFGCPGRVRWVGASAAPDLGAANVTALTEMIRAGLVDNDLVRRNELRASESWLTGLERERDVAINALEMERDAALRARRIARSEHSVAVRTRVQQSRAELLELVRDSCATTRGALRHALAAAPRRDLPAFPGLAVAALTDLADRVRNDAGRRLAAHDGVVRPAFGAMPVDTGQTPPRQSRQEIWLSTVFGAGFGVGVALTLWRLAAGFEPGWSAGCGFACAGMGLALAIWTVRARQSVRDRVVLDRWVGEVTDRVRTATESWVTIRILELEAHWCAAAAAQDAQEALRLSRRLAAIDRGVRGHPRIPAIRQALAAVRTELADLVGSSPVLDLRPRTFGDNPD